MERDHDVTKRICLVLLLLCLQAPSILALTNSDAVGTWICKTDTEQVVEFKLYLFEKNDRLYGKYLTEHQELVLHYLRIWEDALQFQTETKGMKIKYRATIDGNDIKGTITNGEFSIDFTGTRKVPEKKKASPEKE